MRTSAGTTEAGLSATEDAAAAARWGWDRYDALIIAAAVVATLFVHPISAMLQHPYWFDEVWVADLTRVPWSRLVGFSSVAPVGFVVLLKFVPGAGLQRGRLVVLSFSAASAAMAYVLVRTCSWTSASRARFAGTLAALVTMLAPFSLARNDLKQYTCDAFCALLIFTVAVRVDRASQPTPVWWLAVVSLASVPFSSTAAFVSAAAFAGLLGSAALTRSRRRFVELLVTGGATGVLLVTYLAVVVLPNDNADIRNYWIPFYLRGLPWTMLHDGWTRLSALHNWLAMPTIVFVALFVAGLANLARLRERALVLAVPMLWFEMAVLARLRRYPFLDRRTSHFLLVASIVVVAIGAAGLLEVVYRRWRVVGVAIGIGLAAGFAVRFAPHVNGLQLPSEDVRAPTVYVAEHRTSHDVILVSRSASYGFSFYWPHGRLVAAGIDTGQGFLPSVAGLDAIYTTGATDDAVLAGLRQAVARWRAAGPANRLFIVRSHESGGEEVAWDRAFAALDLHPRELAVGPERLLVVGPS